MPSAVGTVRLRALEVGRIRGYGPERARAVNPPFLHKPELPEDAQAAPGQLGASRLAFLAPQGVSAVAVFARVMRSQVLTVTRAPFIEASALQGGSRLHILFRHVLPNAYRSVLALSVLQFGVAILVIAGLAFLGYGDPPPASDWGLLVSAGKEYVMAPWLVTYPAVVIVVVVLAVNRISRWLRR